VGLPTGSDAGSPSLVAVAEAVAREAGALVRERRDAVGRVAVAATKSTPTDVVTAADLAAEALLRRRLAELRPGDGVLGEEQGAETGTTGCTWVVDPIDGTVNYLYGIPQYAVSVAVRGRVPAGGAAVDAVLAACVHNPVSGETFTAERGAGAWLDGRRLRLGPPPALAAALVAVGFGYAPARRRHQARVLAEVAPLVRDVRRMGAASLDLCAVACGRLDGYFEKGLQPWDLAAGGLVAQESGALVTGLRGAPAGEAMTVAAAAGLHEPLCALLERLDADGDA
jgi:myo-inositol-1(or 4)-monophosphatase